MAVKRDKDSISALFAQWDQDGSGTIDREELTSVMKTLCGMDDDDIAALLAEADSNKDGVIDYEEFLNWLMLPAKDSLGSAVVDYAKVLKPVFDCYDRNGSGSISFDEFQECQQIMVASLQMNASEEDGDGELKLFDVSKCQESTFESVDRSGDGEVSFGEFVEWQRKSLANSGMTTEQANEFLSSIVHTLGGIFQIQEMFSAGAVGDEVEGKLMELIQKLSTNLKSMDAGLQNKPTGGGTAEKGGWTEPPPGMSVDRLKGTYLKSYPLKMRGVEDVTLETMCIPLPEIGDDPTGADRGWLAQVVRKVTYDTGKVKKARSAYFKYERDSFSWNVMAKKDAEEFETSLEAMGKEMRIFCLMKTEANFGIELNWDRIMAGLAGAVDMDLISEEQEKVFGAHMQKESLKIAEAEGYTLNLEERSKEMRSKVVLRPREVMAILVKLGIVEIHDEWASFVNHD